MSSLAHRVQTPSRRRLANLPSNSLSDGRRERVADLEICGRLACEDLPVVREPLDPSRHTDRQARQPRESRLGSFFCQRLAVDAEQLPPARARVGPRSGPPCFFEPPTKVGAMRAARSAHASTSPSRWLPSSRAQACRLSVAPSQAA